MNKNSPASTANAAAIVKVRKRKILSLLINSSMGEMRFRWNQTLHAPHTKRYIETTSRIIQGAIFPYYLGTDENGIARGGNLYWHYPHDVCEGINDLQKLKILRSRLAQLPPNVTFSFKTSPDIKDSSIVRTAFRESGFMLQSRTTFVYDGSTAQDLVATLKPDARTKVNAARRDLEIVPMDVDHFFNFYRETITATGHKNHFFLNIDHDIIRQGCEFQPSPIEIFAVRRKGTGENGGTHPIEAAMACGHGSDGYYKLMRIAYIRENASAAFKPHKHAVKLLVLEAMRRSNERGLKLDSDGATVGAGTVYSRFGVFRAVEQDEFVRKAPQALLRKFF